MVADAAHVIVHPPTAEPSAANRATNTPNTPSSIPGNREKKGHTVFKLNKSVAAHAAIASCLVVGFAIADDHNSHTPATPPDGITGEDLLGMGPDISEQQIQQAMADYMKLSQKSDGHKVLERFAGDWDVTQTMLMPGMPETKAEATATNTLVLDGKYLKTDYSGSMMGQPFDGIGIMGYDNLRKQFFMFWCDSAGTSPYLSHGSLSQDGTTITLIGPMDEPMTGEIGKPAMWKTTWINEDSYMMEAFEIVYGDPMPVIRFTYNRK